MTVSRRSFLAAVLASAAAPAIVRAEILMVRPRRLFVPNAALIDTRYDAWMHQQLRSIGCSLDIPLRELARGFSEMEYRSACAAAAFTLMCEPLKNAADRIEGEAHG
jgi:hypothetical protein